MRCWIYNTQLETYKHLCEDDGIQPIVIEQAEGKALVDMTVHISFVWNMLGYWHELA
jgi:hypothetical protein